MSDPKDSEPVAPGRGGLPLTLRQRRLRLITAVLLAVIGVMVTTGALHPFFRLRRLAPGEVLTEELRRAMAAKALFILGYWTLCLLLAFSLFLLAWLYIRDVRLQLLIAQRDMWRELARKAREEHRE